MSTASSSIPMTGFLDFVLSAGLSRLTTINMAGKYETMVDFYRPVREAIVEMHQAGLDTVVLDDLLASLIDPRERLIFPKVVNGYKKFLRQGKVTWFEPPMRDYPLGPIRVRVAPEVGLLVDGKPHVIALSFRGLTAMDPQRIGLTTTLLADALGTTWPGTTFAVLDVRAAKLHTHTPRTEHGLLLRAEASCFAHLAGAM